MVSLGSVEEVEGTTLVASGDGSQLLVPFRVFVDRLRRLRTKVDHGRRRLAVEESWLDGVEIEV